MVWIVFPRPISSARITLFSLKQKGAPILYYAFTTCIHEMPCLADRLNFLPAKQNGNILNVVLFQTS